MKNNSEDTTAFINKENISAGDTEKKDNYINANNKSYEQNNIEIKIFLNSDKQSYGYDILRNGQTYIHQPNIPALPGNNGFSSDNQAKRVAELVAFKIRNNVLPPTVDVNELDSLGIK